MQGYQRGLIQGSTIREGAAPRTIPGVSPDPATSAEGNPPGDDLQVADNPDAQRFEARLGGRVVGFSEYRRVADRVVFLHTEVEPQVEGQGIGSRLVAGALDDVRGRGLHVTPRCPFVADFIERHPDYQDLVAR